VDIGSMVEENLDNVKAALCCCELKGSGKVSVIDIIIDISSFSKQSVNFRNIPMDDCYAEGILYIPGIAETAGATPCEQRQYI
jgi:hypothetical protein